MSNTKQELYTEQEVKRLIELFKSGAKANEIAAEFNRSHSSVVSKIRRLRGDGILDKNDRRKLPQSPFNILGEDDGVLISEGDAVVVPDLETPFHHADFVNHVLDLAYSWDIKTLHLAGDMMHYDTLSKWGAKWSSKDEKQASALQVEPSHSHY